MFETLFKFPIIMIDGDNEERKAKWEKRFGEFSTEPEEEREVDIIIGEAECPYHDFVCITDRWIPREESLAKAMEGEFDACFVRFGQSGDFVIPWSKAKFKEELKNFVEGLVSLKNEESKV